MRILTGKWYLKRRKFFGGFTVMVEVKKVSVCPYSCDRGPEFTMYEPADYFDLEALKIKVR